jgi:hypothetical protein
MTAYSVRCRNSACRHRRVTRTHPDEYKVVPPCPCCDAKAGWRIEGRTYNKRNLCRCGGPLNLETAMPFPHKTTHPLCDQHPLGYYNQAKRAGVPDEDIPEEFRPASVNAVLRLAA